MKFQHFLAKRNAYKTADFADAFLEIIDQVLVTVLMDRQWEPGAYDLCQLHHGIIGGGSSFESEQLIHGSVDLEVATEAAKNNVARIAKRKNDLRVREEPGNER